MAKETDSEIRVTKKVKVITPKGKYTNTPYYYAVPVSVASRLYLTGQQHVFTTEAKWSGKEKLTSTEKVNLQMGDTPFLIDPMQHIVIRHGYEYDDSYISYIGQDKYGKDVENNRVYVNPRDHAELTCILAASDSPVAKSKAEYNKNKHNFYVDDKEKEAQETINTIDVSYEAEKFVREDIGSGRYKEILIFLGHVVPVYKVNPEHLSDTRLKSIVLDACRKYPNEVLKMKGPGANKIIFVTKVINMGIISRKKNNDFYFGDSIYIGSNFDAVVDWIDDKKNVAIVNKWQHQLDYKERKSKEEIVEEPVNG